MTVEQIAISALAAVVALWPNLAGFAEKAAAGVGGLVADKLVTPHTPRPRGGRGFVSRSHCRPRQRANQATEDRASP